MICMVQWQILFTLLWETASVARFGYPCWSGANILWKPRDNCTWMEKKSKRLHLLLSTVKCGYESQTTFPRTKNCSRYRRFLNVWSLWINKFSEHELVGTMGKFVVTWGWYCGIVGWTTASDDSLPYRHKVSSWLFHLYEPPPC